MYKILVVDEEQLFIDNIIDIISKKIEPAKVIAQARTGKQAVDIASEIKPDIIILDIKISGINGLEVIKLIKKFLPNIHIVIVSAYDYYGFLREAIRLNVDDYILKPLNKTNFIEVMNKVIGDIQMEEECSKREEENEIILKDTTQFAEQNFIYNALFKGCFEADINRFRSILNIGEKGFFLNIEITSCNANQMYQSDGIHSNMYEPIKQTLRKYNVNGVIGPRIMNRIVVFISDDALLNQETNQKERVKVLSNEVNNLLNNKYGIVTRIGIGSTVMLKDLYISYEESILCIMGSADGQVLHIGELENVNCIDHYDYYEIESRLIESIKLVKDDVIEIFYTLLNSIKELNVLSKKNKILELFVLSCHATRSNNRNENEYFNYLEVIEELKYLHSNEIDSWAIKKFHLIIKVMRMGNNDKVSNVVSMALRYIEEHYKEELSLEDVSKHVSVSPQYLSKLFKEETDNNFVEYTTRLRIEKAKDLINRTDKTIKEICYMVGYHDPNYFSRKFKSIVGISPTDYLKGKEVAL